MLHEFEGLIKEELADKKQKSLFGDVIDWTLVNESAEYLSDRLVYVLGAGNEDESESMLRGIYFARQVVALIFGGGNSLCLPEYFGRIEDVDELRQNIHDDTQQYLATRPNVDGLMRRHMHEIDEGRTYPHRVEEVCALIFMSSEARLAEKYIEKNLDNYGL